MSTPGRNDPCPCGSGKKFKKCCLLTAQLTSPPAAGAGEEGGLYEALSDDEYLGGRRTLDPKIEMMARRESSRIEAEGVDPDALIAFAEPMLSQTGGARADVSLAMTMGLFFWQLSRLSKASLRERTMAMLMPGLSAASGISDVKFRHIASRMIKRHQILFPEMHKQEEGNAQP